MHPEDSVGDPGGGLRVVATGTVVFQGNKYMPGDWFFVPNGQPYDFKSDEVTDTVVFYLYRFFRQLKVIDFLIRKMLEDWSSFIGVFRKFLVFSVKL